MLPDKPKKLPRELVEAILPGQPGHRLTETGRPSMIRELQRWNNPTTLKIVHPRWAEWAGSMIGRHRITVAAAGGQPMTFVQPARLVQLHQRLINFSLNFHSRLNLAIQPILREIRMGEQKANRARPVQPDGSRASQREDADTTLLRTTGLANETGTFVTARPGTFAQKGIAAPGMTSETQFARARSADSTADHHSSSRIESSAGVPLVFRRLQPRDEFAGRDQSERIHEDLGQLALRIGSQSKRIEESMTGSTPQVARRLTAATTQQAAPQVVATEYASQQTLGMFRSNEPWRANTPQLPDAMLEQVTERVIREIDQRTIAWRERMGKT